MNNPNKRFEDDRRKQRINNATDDYGLTQDTPDYLAKAAQIAKSMNIKYYVSKEEADPHVA
jgi:hypothetical protein